MDALILSRMQFAANISFHILFPTITIALCWFLLFFRLRFVQTRDPAWEEAYYFWTKVFALTFALGVVSGIVMSFQFGTNWPGFMEKTGNIAGPLLGYEVLTAFFLEASFLGIMLFGRGRVSERVHLVATLLVAFGTTMSAFWILSLNSWLQTPAGYEIVNGQFYATDWWAVIFNPSLPYRLTHMLIASGLTAAFLSNYLLAAKAGASTEALWGGHAAWRWMFWMQAVPSLLFLALLLTIPESPRYLAVKRRKDEALQVLPVALQVFKTQTPQGQPDWTGLMAATTVALLPTLILLLTLGRRVVESVQHSGGK